jgi:creatinine amidohydrolase/Fe(II)-dependent formamide hydrolase-like protein
MIVKAIQSLFFSLILLGAQSAFASDTSVFLEDLTWTELKAQIASGKTTILIPIGGTEQSGPYVALGKHNMRAKLLAEKIAHELGNALVAPTIAYVPEGSITPPTAHMRFPGTITVSDDVFEKTLESAARSFKLHGFRNVFFLGDHGGYQQDMKIAADLLNKEWAGSAAHASATPEYYQATQVEYVRFLKSKGFSDDEIGKHAGLADTSLTMALDPHMVRADKLPSATPSAAMGMYGDPRKSTAALGEPGVDAVVSKTVEAIRAAARQ